MIFIAHRRNTLEELNTTPVEYGMRSISAAAAKTSSSTMMRWFRAEISEWIAAYRHGTLILNVRKRDWRRACFPMDSHGITDFFFLDQSFPFLVKWAKAASSAAPSAYRIRIHRYRAQSRGQSRLGLGGLLHALSVERGRGARLQDAGFRLCIVSPELQGRNAETEIPAYAALLTERGIAAKAVCTKRPDLWKIALGLQ